MGKKLLLPTLICLSLASLASGVAVYAEDNPYGDDYWTLSEVLDLKEDIKNQVWEICGASADPFCANMEYDSLRWSDSKGAAVDNLREFLITSISPKEGKIRYFYQDENEWSMFDPYAPRYGLTQLYLGWFNLPVNSMDYGIMWDYANNSLSSAVTLVLDEDYFEGPNQEIERDVVPGSLIGNDRYDEIYYRAFFEDGSVYGGLASYGGCLESSPFENTECRLMFSKTTGDGVYLPFEILIEQQIVDPTPEPEPEPIPDPEPISEPEPELPAPEPVVDLTSDPEPVEPDFTPDPISEPEVPEPEPETLEPELISDPDSESEVVPDSEPVFNPEPELISTSEPILASEPQEPAILPTTPDTGTAQEPISCERTIEFPWWIMLLVAAGEALIIWWFSPTSKNRKKL